MNLYIARNLQCPLGMKLNKMWCASECCILGMFYLLMFNTKILTQAVDWLLNFDWLLGAFSLRKPDQTCDVGKCELKFLVIEMCEMPYG